MNTYRKLLQLTVILALGGLAGISAGCGEDQNPTANAPADESSSDESSMKQKAAAAGKAARDKADSTAKQGIDASAEATKSQGAAAAAGGAAAAASSAGQTQDKTKQTTGRTQDAQDKKASEQSQDDMKVAQASDSEEGQKGEKAAETKADAAGQAQGGGDLATVGYKRYQATCHVCHGPFGVGSTIGPSLVDGLKNMEKGEFINIVAAGRKVYQSWNQSYSVMPAWGTNKEVMADIEGLWVYLKGRSDGKIGTGAPK